MIFFFNLKQRGQAERNNLIKAGDYLALPDIPDKRSVAGRCPGYAVQVPWRTHKDRQVIVVSISIHSSIG